MATKQDVVFFTMIASILLAILGLIFLLVSMSHGVMQLKGISLGVGSGLWLIVVLFVVRAMHAKGKNKKTLGRLPVFLAAAIDVGVLYHYELQLRYLGAHKTAVGMAHLEQLTGMLWALSLAAIYLSLQEYRRLRTLTKLACSPLWRHQGSLFDPDFLKIKWGGK